jgi:aminoglycoside phosphotransferase
VSTDPDELRPPPAVLDHLGLGPWEPQDPTNSGRSRVWRVGDRYVKFVPAGAPGPSVTDEADRLAWMQGRVPAPRPVVAATTDDGRGWLVTGTADGRPAHLGDRHLDPGQVVAAVAAGLRGLHALAVDECPFDAGWDRLDAEVGESLAAGRIDPAALPEPFCRYPAERLVELWRQGRPPPDDPVVVHGDACLPNLLVDGAAFTAMVDVGRLGVGDRHLDLAILHHSLHRNLGPQAVFGFYDAYGRDPDLARLEHYRLGDLLR